MITAEAGTRRASEDVWLLQHMRGTAVHQGLLLLSLPSP